MKNKDKDIVTAKAWVGEWGSAGTIGWLLPVCIDGRDETPDFHQYEVAGRFPEGVTLYRCHVTVERLRDKRGRYITKKIGGGGG